MFTIILKKLPGPSQSRIALTRKQGEYDHSRFDRCVLPPGYLKAGMTVAQHSFRRLWGPDRAHSSFTATQNRHPVTPWQVYHRWYPWKARKNWISSIPVLSIWEYVVGVSKLEDSPRCVSTKILTSVSIFKSRLSVPSVSRSMGMAQTPHRHAKFFRRVYNSGIARINLYKISRFSEARSSSSNGIYRRGLCSILYRQWDAFSWLMIFGHALV